jgi:hypothetical protein
VSARWVEDESQAGAINRSVLKPGHLLSGGQPAVPFYGGKFLRVNRAKNRASKHGNLNIALALSQMAPYKTTRTTMRKVHSANHFALRFAPEMLGQRMRCESHMSRAQSRMRPPSNRESLGF